ncbi:MAG: asparagine synthetase B family protein [Planctomyces sp.]
MCGIAGIYRVSATPIASRDAMSDHAAASWSIPDHWLDTLDRAIVHRGPDGQGRFRARSIAPSGHLVEVAFVHRRLSVIDPQGGAQPMLAPSGDADSPASPALARAAVAHARPADHLSAGALANIPPGNAAFAIVFNGCIYNHRSLRAALSAHRFRTDHSDTETLLHVLAGDTSALPKLDGMFALALWNASDASLTLARDRAGEKPLHVLELTTATERIVAFCSSAAGLVPLRRLIQPQVSLRINTGALASFFAMGFGPAFPADGFSSVPPASRLTIAPGTRTLATFADAPPSAALEPTERTNRPDAATIDALVRQSVRERMESDVPLGCFLSGGIDSSLVAAHAAKFAPGLRTFTVRMPVSAYDESGVAGAVAQALGTNHPTVEAGPAPGQSIADDLAGLVATLGIPLADSSLLPSTWLARAVRQHVGVALSGDGGDDLFGGYQRQAAADLLAGNSGDLLRALPSSLCALACAVLSRGASPKSTRGKLSRLIDAARGGQTLDLLAIFPRSMLPPGLNPQPDPLADAWSTRGTAGALAIDRYRYLPQDLLTKVDTASMSCALEVRAPLLSAALLDVSRSAHLDALMPSAFPMRRLKVLLRAAAARHVPASLLDRPKMGFALPLGHFFRDDAMGIRRSLLASTLDASREACPIPGLSIHRTFIERLVREHQFGAADHAQRLYALLVAAIWTRWVASADAG